MCYMSPVDLALFALCELFVVLLNVDGAVGFALQNTIAFHISTSLVSTLVTIGEDAARERVPLGVE